MNKAGLIKELTSVLGQRKEAQRAVSKFIQTLRESIRKGEKVILAGFGSFYPRIRKAQKRHNPKTMEPVHVPPKRIVKFIPSEDLYR